MSTILEYIGQEANLNNLLSSPIIIGQLSPKITNDDIKTLLGYMATEFNLLSEFFPLPSLPNIESISTLNSKGLTDVCMELISMRGIKPSSGEWNGLKPIEYFLYWRLSEYLAIRGFMGKPIVKIPRNSSELNPIPHFHVKYYCPFGCVNVMQLNLNVQSNEIKSQLYILWMIQHLKEFHKIDLSLLDNFLMVDSIPEIFEVIPEKKGDKSIMPKLEYLNNSKCPKCNSKHIGILSPNLFMCQDSNCNHMGNEREFKP